MAPRTARPTGGAQLGHARAEIKLRSKGLAYTKRMAAKMVSRYLRFADKTASARASRDRRERKMAEFENSAVV